MQAEYKWIETESFYFYYRNGYGILCVNKISSFPWLYKSYTIEKYGNWEKIASYRKLTDAILAAEAYARLKYSNKDASLSDYELSEDKCEEKIEAEIASDIDAKEPSESTEKPKGYKTVDIKDIVFEQEDKFSRYVMNMARECLLFRRISGWGPATLNHAFKDIDGQLVDVYIDIRLKQNAS